jgi:hypothetical protein
VSLERGTLGPLPYAALGQGPPLAVLAGLSPTTVMRDRGLRPALAAFLAR